MISCIALGAVLSATTVERVTEVSFAQSALPQFTMRAKMVQSDGAWKPVNFDMEGMTRLTKNQEKAEAEIFFGRGNSATKLPFPLAGDSSRFLIEEISLDRIRFLRGESGGKLSWTAKKIEGVQFQIRKSSAREFSQRIEQIPITISYKVKRDKVTESGSATGIVSVDNVRELLLSIRLTWTVGAYGSLPNCRVIDSMRFGTEEPTAPASYLEL